MADYSKHDNSDNHLDKFREAYEQSQSKSKPSKAELHEDISIGFPPVGKHIVRPFSDLNGESVRKVIVHHIGRRNRTLCPDSYKNKNSNQDYPKCKICSLSHKYNLWKYKAKSLYMAYGLLIETDKPKDYWKSGRVHLILMKDKLYKAFEKMAQGILDQDKSIWNEFLDPKIPSYAIKISMEETAPGVFANMTPVFSKIVPPIELGDWYKPLSECWVKEFNISDYEKMLASAQNSIS
jgi:hypothetical protein